MRRDGKRDIVDDLDLDTLRQFARDLAMDASKFLRELEEAKAENERLRRGFQRALFDLSWCLGFIEETGTSVSRMKETLRAALEETSS